ncbi:transcription elongation factor GreA/GreB C-terminal domain protein [Bacteriovorax sp. BAL6_X]|uniref:GreA/GreB family elongation factor n=1 Tax=Bacteriovorax sp. BAL6_X TaxID=1201290 RepID=UPI0003864146|nr:GreA/GreB family elongation factor [Bacteriovorax sp. BAL6_X]EPZ51359.1 transcription elongation factor GreA/GreB C-terminal domain protein [Bacteriovorax sp. BAL6_X]
MNKETIISTLIENLETELTKAKAAFETTRTMSQEPDMAQEGKYDTRAIEAGYLAGAQKKRVDELEIDINMIKELSEELPNGDKIALGSLVELKFNEQTRHYFITPTAGGTMLNLDGTPLLVISVFSPIGNEALGMEVGDIFDVETGDITREYEVVSIS